MQVPLRRRHSFDRVRSFAREAAELLAERHPDRLTVEQRKAKRGGRLYLDFTRNAWGQTVVPPFAVRARPSAPVAMPIPWSALDDRSVGPQSFRVDNVVEALQRDDDPWHGFGRHAQSLADAEKRLARLTS